MLSLSTIRETLDTMSTIFPLKNCRRVYCAGPLFNEAERREMTQIAEVLGDFGFETFLPHADGMEFAEVQPFMLSQGYDADDVGQILHSAIFALDVYQVAVGCGSLVFNMNGRTPDEGAVAEATMAWMLGKPIVLFKEDARSAICGRDNPLVVGTTAFETLGDMQLLGRALRDRIDSNPLNESWEVQCPPHLEQTIAAGARLWSQLNSLDGSRDSAAISEIVLNLFGRRQTTAA